LLNDNLKENCELIENKLSKYHLDQFEIYGLTTSQVSVQLKKGSIKDFTEYYDSGVGIRVIKDKRIGFAFSSSFDMSKVEKLINRVIKFTRVGVPDLDFQKLPSPKKYPELTNLIDPKIVNLTPEAVINYLERMVSAANVNNKIYSISGEFTSDIYHEVILNSNGVNRETEHSEIDIFCNVTTKDMGNTGSSFDFQSVRFLKEIEPERIGENAANLALRSLNSKKLKTSSMPVIFHPIASSTILGSGIGTAISAEQIQYQQSYLIDKLNEKLFTMDIFIEDNGIYIKENNIPGVGSSNFDAEGFPTQKTIIFESGVLKNYIHNSYTANKEKVANTGNASRFGYKSTPTISITNLVFHPGNDGELNDLIDETKEGIVLYYTGDTPNIITGDLSAMIHTGFYIKDGEPIYGIKNTMIGINMIDFFKNIDMVGSKIESLARIHIPPFRVSNVRISGN